MKTKDKRVLRAIGLGHRRFRGFATLEYCLVCLLVVMVLFVSPATPEALVDAFKAFFRSLTFYISLP